METITFYSYKGGVGRTLALANVASYLSRFGQKVCILDFDLEAPGVHYKFPQITTKVNYGIVDYIHSFFNEDEKQADSISEYSVQIVSDDRSIGDISIIPAGNVGNPDYWKKLASLNWHEIFYAEDSEGMLFFIELQQRIKEELKPDFLLIDSRTGVTEISSLSTAILADKIVFLCANNKENLDGSRQIISGIEKIERFSWQRPVEITFALTRIPETSEKREQEIIKKVYGEINKNEKLIKIEDICILHSDRDLELAETVRLSTESMNINKDIPLIKDYLKLFSKAISEEIIKTKITGFIERITSSANLLEDPDKVCKDLEDLVEVFPHRISMEKLIYFYILRNESQDKLLGTFHKLYSFFGISDHKMLSKYKEVFMKTEFRSWQAPKFNLKIIEEYLKQEPEDKIAVKIRLAEAYLAYENKNEAVKLYSELMENHPREDILKKFISLLIRESKYEIALKIMNQYSNITSGQDVELNLLKVEIFTNLKMLDSLRYLMQDEELKQRLIMDKPHLYTMVVGELNIAADIQSLNETLKKGISNREYSLVRELREIYFNLNKADVYENILKGSRIGREMLNDFSRLYF